MADPAALAKLVWSNGQLRGARRTSLPRKPSAFDREVLCWKCLFLVRTLPGEHGGMGRAGPFAIRCSPRRLRDPNAAFSEKANTIPHLWRFSDTGPCRTAQQPRGPVSENPQGMNPREVWRGATGAMGIYMPPPALLGKSTGVRKRRFEDCWALRLLFRGAAVCADRPITA